MCPCVSIIIPTHNRAGLLAAALASVQAQTFRDFEVLVIDDGSTEDLAPAIASFAGPIRCIRIDRAGPAAARNAGLDATAGEYVAFLDSDDIWLPAHLERCMAVLRGDPAVGLVYHEAIPIDESGAPSPPRRARPHPSGRVTDTLFAYDFIPTPAVVCRRALLERAGRFDRALPRGQDYDLWLRMSLLCDFAFLNEPLMHRRTHAGQLSRRHKALAEVCRAILKDRFYHDNRPGGALDEAAARSVLARAFYRAGRHLRAGGWRDSARRFLHHSLAYRPLYPPALLQLTLSHLGATWPPTASDPAVEILQATGYRLPHASASRP